MAVLIGSGMLSTGGAVVETSGGVKYALFRDTSGAYLEVYKNIDGTPSLVCHESLYAAFGSGTYNLGGIAAGIDGNDDIHVVLVNGVAGTYDVIYAVFDTGTDSFGSWVEIAGYTNVAPNYPGCALSIDSSGYPHVLFVDNVKQQGTAGDNVYYIYYNGSVWSTPEQVGLRDTKTDVYHYPALTVRNGDYVEAWYYGLISSADYTCYRGTNYLGWSDEEVYAGGALPLYGITSTPDPTVYRVHVDIDKNVEEGNVDTGYDALTVTGPACAVLSPEDGTTRYIFFIDGSYHVRLISNDGGGWTDEGALQTAVTCYIVIAEWAYNNENQSGEINYIFYDSGNTYVWYDSFSIGGPGVVAFTAYALAQSVTPAAELQRIVGWVAQGLAATATPDDVTLDTAPEGVSQRHFRVRSGDDQALNADAGWAAALDADLTMDAGTRFRVRFEVEEAAGEQQVGTFRLQYRYDATGTGSSYGSWTDVPIRDESGSAGGPIEAFESAMYTHGAATANVLAGSLETFEAGYGVSLERATPTSQTLQNEHTEHEFCLEIIGTWGGPNQIADDGLIQLRLVWGTGTPFAGIYAIPTLTVNVPDYYIGAIFLESPGRVGPFIDGNGNLYVLIEPAHTSGDGNNEDEILKSTDGGKTWAMVDIAHSPGINDFECIDIRQAGDTLHILGQDGSSDSGVWYHTFRMSDHATNPDTWGIVDESVEDVIGASDQGCGLEVRSDGTVVAVYRRTTKVAYRIRSSGGTWGSVVDLDTANDHFLFAGIVKGASDKCHIFYKDDDADVLYHKSLTSGDSLSAREAVESDIWADDDRWGTTPPVYWDDAGDEKIMIIVHDSSDELLYSVVITNDGTPESRKQVAGGVVPEDQASSSQPMADLVIDPETDTAYALFALEADMDLYIDAAENDGGWGSDEHVLTGAFNFARGTVFTHSQANGGAKVLGYFYENDPIDEGLEGDIWYGEYELAAGGTVTFAASALAGSSTQAGALAVERALVALALGGTGTPAATLAAARALAAAAQGATGTPAADLQRVVGWIAQILAGTTAPDAVGIGITRGMAAAALAGATAPDAVTLAALRALIAAALGASATPDDAELLVAGLVSFLATAIAATGTPAAALERIVGWAMQALAATSTPADAELTVDAGGYGYAGEITVDHDLVIADQTDFPILISGTYDGTGGLPDLRTVANGGHVENTALGGASGALTVPADLVFGPNLDGSTPYAFEIQTYDPATGKIRAWVQASSLSSSVDPILYVTYGDPSVTESQEDVAGTWSDDYVAVYHLEEASGQVYDSTGYGNHGAAAGGPTYGATGQVEKCVQFDGGDDKFTVTYDTSLDVDPGTWEAWVKAHVIGSSPADEHTWIAKRSGTPSDYQFYVSNASPPATINARFESAAFTSSGTMAVDVWYHITWTFARPDLDLYWNGGSHEGFTYDYDLVNRAVSLYLSTKDGAAEWWNGWLDEIRISAVARTAAYVQTNYNTQSSPGTFYSMGAEQSLSGTVDFVATALAGTAAPDAALVALRTLAAAAQAGSATASAALATLRAFAAGVLAGTATPDDVDLLIGALVTFAADALGGTATSEANLTRIVGWAVQALAGTGTPAVTLATLRAFTAGAFAGTVAPDDVDLLIGALVTFTADALAATATPAADLVRIVGWISDALVATGTPDADLVALRAFTAGALAGTVAPEDVDLLIGALVTFTADALAGTTTPNADLVRIAGMIAGALAGTGTPAATLATLRAFTAGTLAGTGTPDDVDLLIGALVTFAADALAGTTTPDATLVALRALAAVALAASGAPDDVPLAVLRAMFADALAGTGTPDGVALARAVGWAVQALAGTAAPDNAPLIAQRAMLAGALGASATPDEVDLLIGAMATFTAYALAGTTAPDEVAVIVRRAMTAAGQGATATPAAVLGLIRPVIAAALAGTATPGAIPLGITRGMAADAQVATALPDGVALQRIVGWIVGALAATATPDDVELFVAGIVGLAAAALAGTGTSAPLLAVLRPLLATALGDTAMADAILTRVRPFLAGALAATATPDGVPFERLRAMLAAALGDTATPDAVLVARRGMAALAEAGSITPAGVLTVRRALVALALGGSSTPQDVLLEVGIVLGILRVLVAGGRPGAMAGGRQGAIAGMGRAAGGTGSGRGPGDE